MTRDYVVIVSGMPRSGTSLMMQMLNAGGIAPLTDGIRKSDEHNPHGYLEYEPVKRLAYDSSWVPDARGKALKVIYRLLPHLPPEVDYRVILMDRDIEQVFESQRDMLRTRGDAAADQHKDRIIKALAAEIEDTKEWLSEQPNVRVLAVPYASLVRDPAFWSQMVTHFLDGGLNERAMAAMVVPSLYRHR
ncbi:MAG TPA: sulfotransferase domain-containing protein [Bryobacteraceae bacterium]|nr:sulfotransferase domain-containing protein [Bryobacteraceae bacterium]